MKYVKQFGIILVISFVGEVLHSLLPFPVPASIYGIIVMFVCLEAGWIQAEAVSETGKFLVEIMPVMFIPAAVELLEAWDLLQPAWLPYVSITVITTVVVMAVSGLVTQGMIKNGKKKKGEK